MCNHSVQSAEEIVKHAIELGMKTIGISEHEPIRNKEWDFALESHEQMEEFFDIMDGLKEKYGDQIKILTGLEIEPREPQTGIDNIEWVKDLQKNPRVEYVVMGHHYFRSGGHIFNYKATDEEHEHYLEDLDRGLAEIKPLYLAHPDGLVQGEGEINDRVRKVWKGVIDIAIKHNTPIGINMLGIFKHKHRDQNPGYTQLEFFKMAAAAGARAHIEADTHRDTHWGEEIYLAAKKIADDSGIELVEELL